MKTLSIIVFTIAFISHSILAQDTSNIVKPKPPIPIEILIGHNSFFSQLIINRTFTKKNKLGIFNASVFNVNYKNDSSQIEYNTSTALYFNVFKGIGIHGGATLSSKEGFKPFIGPQFMFMNRTLQILYFPNFYFGDNHKITNLLLLEFKPVLHKKWSLYVRLQGYFAYNLHTKTHSRSYLQTRVGISYSIYTLGFGVNLDWYGDQKIERDNIGAFLRINL